MAKRSIYRDFITLLRRDWRITFPYIRPIEKSFPLMPKASTFYAGPIRQHAAHAFLKFQHSDKKVGQFTINVILSQQMGPPSTWVLRFPEELEVLAEGQYRIGLLNGGRDKWWRLKDNDSTFECGLEDSAPIDFKGWQPASFADYDAVLAEAVVDVNRDIVAALRKIGCPCPNLPVAAQSRPLFPRRH